MRWEALARYNAERARGIEHSPEWRELMELEQQAFGEHQYVLMRSDGWEEIAPGVWAQRFNPSRPSWLRRLLRRLW